jgi:hypothetical protein
MRRDVQVTLIESVGKKATFLREVARDYPNVRVLQVRLESIDGHFDWATVRAVAPGPLLDLLSERATNLALLIGQKDASELGRSDLFNFDPPRRLPWGDRRVLLVGRSRRLK